MMTDLTTYPASPAPAASREPLPSLATDLPSGALVVPAGTGEPGPFSRWVLNLGFIAGLLLAGGCLALSAVYLYGFLSSTNAAIETFLARAATTEATDRLLELAINARMVMARLALLSCGAFVGMSFGFLGFALFLLGIKGEMEVQGRYEGAEVKISRMAPGILIILCAAILIGVCATRSTPFRYTLEEETPSARSDAKVPDAGPPPKLPRGR